MKEGEGPMIDRQRVLEICRRVCTGGEGAASIRDIHGINLKGDLGGITDIQLTALLGLILIQDPCGDLEKKLTPEEFEAINEFYEGLLTGASE